MQQRTFKQAAYSKKLLDPRWQKKRLEILQRDKFTCTLCGNDRETLHVHHKYYESGYEPWDYEKDTLITLCSTCHEEEGIFIKEQTECLLINLKTNPFLFSQTFYIIEAMTYLHIPDGVNNFDDVLCWALDNNCEVSNVLYDMYKKSKLITDKS